MSELGQPLFVDDVVVLLRVSRGSRGWWVGMAWARADAVTRSSELVGRCASTSHGVCVCVWCRVCVCVMCVCRVSVSVSRACVCVRARARVCVCVDVRRVSCVCVSIFLPRFSVRSVSWTNYTTRGLFTHLLRRNQPRRLSNFGRPTRSSASRVPGLLRGVGRVALCPSLSERWRGPELLLEGPVLFVQLLGKLLPSGARAGCFNACGWAGAGLRAGGSARVQAPVTGIPR